MAFIPILRYLTLEGYAHYSTFLVFLLIVCRRGHQGCRQDDQGGTISLDRASLEEHIDGTDCCCSGGLAINIHQSIVICIIVRSERTPKHSIISLVSGALKNQIVAELSVVVIPNRWLF